MAARTTSGTAIAEAPSAPPAAAAAAALPAAAKQRDEECKAEELSLLERRFSFYGAYHNNGMNQLIHVTFVPVIYWSSLVFTNHIPLPGAITALLSKLPFGLGSPAVIPSVAYATYYLVLSRKLGSAMVPLLAAALVGANKFMAAGGTWKSALALHIIAWAAQFYGHFKYEGRAPALFDSLLESLTMAPLFVSLEVAFALGFLKGFKRRVDKVVARRIAEMDAADAGKRA